MAKLQILFKNYKWYILTWVILLPLTLAVLYAAIIGIYYYFSFWSTEDMEGKPALRFIASYTMGCLCLLVAMGLLKIKGKIITFITMLILGLYIHFWDWFSDGLANGDVVRNLALTVGGIWAAYGVILAAVRVEIMQQQQVSESLAKAVEQLSSEVMSIRILAILSLGKIAVEADKRICRDVIDVLCAYIREKRRVSEEIRIPFSEDMQKIIDVLDEIRGKIPLFFRDYRINFTNTDLSGAIFKHCKLAQVNFSGANLMGANLGFASLLDANLTGANLTGADLFDADLRYANLLGVDLSNAELTNTRLGFASLLNANLSNADLHDVRELDTAHNLETVKNPPQEIIDEIERRKQSGQK